MTERDWTDRPLGQGEGATWGDVTVERRSPGAQLLVTGDLRQAQGTLAGGASPTGLLEDVGQPMVLRQARDRALLVRDDPWGVRSGWQGSFAVSDCGQAWACFALSGPGVPALLAQGTGADLEAGSPSCALRFAGRTAMLVREGAAVLLWVEAGMATYLTGWIRAALS